MFPLDSNFSEYSGVFKAEDNKWRFSEHQWSNRDNAKEIQKKRKEKRKVSQIKWQIMKKILIAY